jgi:SAM-dependent methyltransferase
MSGGAQRPGFDPYARDYKSALDRGLSLTGESQDFFARQRVEIVRDYCQHLGLVVRSVCDYGCGTGGTLPLLKSFLGAERVIGLDPSEASLDEARDKHFAGVELAVPAAFAAESEICDAAYCNGVFHHIPVAGRLSAATQILRLLRPGGCWFFWENNPLNPGTRWVMSRIPFDRDAITLMPWTARQLGIAAGGQVVGQSSHFYFPKALAPLRRLERWLTRFPFGGQYLTVVRKPH